MDRNKAIHPQCSYQTPGLIRVMREVLWSERNFKKKLRKNLLKDWFSMLICY